MQQLSATGNTYDIQIEAKILDDNPRRTTTTGDNSLLGEYKYYSVYTNTILEKLRETEEYQLKNDDYIVVTVKNTNITIGTQLKNFLYKLIGNDTYTIGTSASALIVNNGGNNVEIGKIEVQIQEPTVDTDNLPEETPEEGTGNSEITCPTCLGDRGYSEECPGSWYNSFTEPAPHGPCDGEGRWEDWQCNGCTLFDEVCAVCDGPFVPYSHTRSCTECHR